MDRIDDLAIIEYRVPLRITFEPHTGKLVEHDVREHQMRDDHECISDPSTCAVSGTRDLYARVNPRRAHLAGIPGAVYRFPALELTRSVRVLLFPDQYEVLVEDRDGIGCRCGGLVYRDRHAIRTPKIDLSRVAAELRESTLELLLPRARP